MELCNRVVARGGQRTVSFRLNPAPSPLSQPCRAFSLRELRGTRYSHFYFCIVPPSFLVALSIFKSKEILAARRQNETVRGGACIKRKFTTRTILLLRALEIECRDAILNVKNCLHCALLPFDTYDILNPFSLSLSFFQVNLIIY